MRGLGIVWTWVLLFPLALETSAQCELEEPRSSKAQKLFDKASSPKGKATLEDRLAWLDAALEFEPGDAEVLMAAAELAFKAAGRDAEHWALLTERLDALDEVCPGGMPEAVYLRGAVAYMSNRYEEALASFQTYLSLPQESTRTRRRRDVESTLPELVFLNQYNMHAGRPEPSPIPEISWDEDEYLPLLSPDGSMLFFTRTFFTQAKGDITRTRKEMFTCAQRADVSLPFDGGTPLEDPFNMGSNYGGASISVDNKLMILAANRPVPSNPNNIDLFATEYHVDYRALDGSAVYTWSALVPLGEDVNTPQGWEAQPSISGDGKTLFFAGARAESTPDPDGNLTMDIFSSSLLDNGRWGPAEKLPAPINSAAQDKAPFLHPDGKTLYFSSNRTPSGGGYDLWMSQRDTSGAWSIPINLGRPVNSSGDEHGLVVSTDGKEGIFASRRRGTRGLDLCTYTLPSELRPKPVTVVKGDLGWPIPEGELTVSIEYVQSKRVEQVQFSKEDGRFAAVVQLPEGEDVVLTVEGESVGYRSVVVHEEGSEATAAVTVDMSEKIAPSNRSITQPPFELEDVQFATKQSVLSKRALVILRALANHLERRPELKLDVDGHTDNIGDAQDNLALSVDRAHAVKDFLMSCGVQSDRLTVQGHGESQPKTSNDSEEGRRINRRTEFRWVPGADK